MMMKIEDSSNKHEARITSGAGRSVGFEPKGERRGSVWFSAKTHRVSSAPFSAKVVRGPSERK